MGATCGNEIISILRLIFWIFQKNILYYDKEQDAPSSFDGSNLKSQVLKTQQAKLKN